MLYELNAVGPRGIDSQPENPQCGVLSVLLLTCRETVPAADCRVIAGICGPDLGGVGGRIRPGPCALTGYDACAGIERNGDGVSAHGANSPQYLRSASRRICAAVSTEEKLPKW